MDTTRELSLSGIDLSIIIIYFFIVLAIGLWIGRNTKDGEDLFLAGRSLGWIAIGFSPVCVQHLEHNSDRSRWGCLHDRPGGLKL